MHKEYFMLKLKLGLISMPEKDRNEILDEYDAHFEFGKQQGRTDEEIAKELGDPEELAVELMGESDIKPFNQQAHNQAPPFYGDSNYGPPHAAPPMHEMPPYYPQKERSGVVSRRVFGVIGAFFVSIIVIPLLISGWGVCIGLIGASLGFLLAPFAYILKLSFGATFFGAELSMYIVGFGIGILLAQAIAAICRLYGKLNLAYLHWIANVGRERR
ncbi:DUF1700 domain-containing protein [Paenibacillus sp. ACRRX]|uniref:DUF1700 domain-containing protein n=1 Tax=unclassified Paenibacillus TaxID=185978 RepID=UPI001EF5B221|nr:DUF1700 domain-containing protein [Paenibacillus sp. UMB4589-SE434]MCG7408802.1 DUF1700 domain-containing protein [Paenibacillus sp. ACRRX]MDK8183572.1 DUF1700 domain-containing protein [Paenibacillus sp. UMB4589-SE434]